MHPQAFGIRMASIYTRHGIPGCRNGCDFTEYTRCSDVLNCQIQSFHFYCPHLTALLLCFSNPHHEIERAS